MNFLTYGAIKLLCAHPLKLIVFSSEDLDFYHYFLGSICEVGVFWKKGLIHVRCESSYIINLSSIVNMVKKLKGLEKVVAS